MNWFQRHLNWTWLFAYLIWIPLNYSDDAIPPIIGAIFLLVVSGWVIKQKGRSLWWILLTPLFSPLWLKNMSLVSQSLPTIKDEERQECLAYYEDEKKLHLLYERVEWFFDKRIGKYEDAFFEAQKALRDSLVGKATRDDPTPIPPMEIMDKIFEAREYMSHAATEIVNRKKAMRPAPSAASAMSSAWLAAYLDYEALRDPSNIVASSDSAAVAIQQERAKELSTNFNKSLRKAWKEEKTFRKRLKLTSAEYQSIVDNASRALVADEWLQRLETECP